MTASRQNTETGSQAEPVPPQAASQPEAGGREARRVFRRRAALIAGPLVVIIGALWMYFTGGRYISEEDAYLRAGSVEIAPQVGGRVVKVSVTDNQTVKAGDPLLKIDPEPYQIALKGANANLAAVQNQLRALVDSYHARSDDISEAEANVKFAQTQFDRARTLRQEGTGTQASLDQASRNLHSAQAQLSSLKDQMHSTLAQLGGDADQPVKQQAKYLQAEAAVEKAQRDLRLTQLAAPFAGVVTKVDSVQSGAILAAGQPAFYLVSNEDIWVEANLKETDLTHVAEGDAATVVVVTYPHAVIEAEVASISPASGASFALLPPQNASGNWVNIVQRVPVRLKLKDPPDDLNLVEGMSVQVKIDTAYRRTLGTFFADLGRLVGL